MELQKLHSVRTTDQLTTWVVILGNCVIKTIINILTDELTLNYYATPSFLELI